MKTSSEIRDFYNDFSRTVFMRDFQIINLRLQAVKALCDRFIPDGARILEIGCGAGIMSRHLRRKAAHLVAVDISEAAVAMAKQYNAGSTIEFMVLDITADDSSINRFGPFDAILLSDVLEHIPKERQRGLFEKIENMLAPLGRALITYPSPEYQEYLAKHKPELLQVVDETLHLSDILGATSLKPLYFTYVDAGERNQYIHLVLAPSIEYSPTGAPVSIGRRIIRATRKAVWRMRNRAFLHRIRHGH